MSMLDCLRGLRNSLSLLEVCQATYRLNRVARGSEDKEAIYRYKTLLIHWLHEHRYCSTSVRRQDQVGSYGRVPMYQFAFYVEGEKFIWHQPTNLVNWPVQETGEPLPVWSGVGRHTGKTSLVDLWTVRWFLVLHRLLPIRASRKETKDG